MPNPRDDKSQNTPLYQSAADEGQPVTPDNPTPEPPAAEADKPAKHRRFKGLFSLIELIVAAFLLAIFINHFIFQSYQVFGSSMTPTLHEGDRLIITKVRKSWHELFRGQYVPKRGDIIVFKSPQRSDIQLIKRVVGLPGEHVVVKNGKITVYNKEHPDGFDPDEPYKSFLPQNGTGNIDYTIGEDQLFVSGDNRVPGGSLDSRNDLGLVPIKNVIGELSVRIYPIDDFHAF